MKAALLADYRYKIVLSIIIICTLQCRRGEGGWGNRLQFLYNLFDRKSVRKGNIALLPSIPTTYSYSTHFFKHGIIHISTNNTYTHIRMHNVDGWCKSRYVKDRGNAGGGKREIKLKDSLNTSYLFYEKRQFKILLHMPLAVQHSAQKEAGGGR